MSISDNGIGFNAERSEQLFGVFKRLHKTEEFEGHGHRPGHRSTDRPETWRHFAGLKGEGHGATVYLRFQR